MSKLEGGLIPIQEDIIRKLGLLSFSVVGRSPLVRRELEAEAKFFQTSQGAQSYLEGIGKKIPQESLHTLDFFPEEEELQLPFSIRHRVSESEDASVPTSIVTLKNSLVDDPEGVKRRLETNIILCAEIRQDDIAERLHSLGLIPADPQPQKERRSYLVNGNYNVKVSFDQIPSREIRFTEVEAVAEIPSRISRKEVKKRGVLVAGRVTTFVNEQGENMGISMDQASSTTTKRLLAATTVCL